MSKEKILIVDDEEDILELVRFNLEKEGYRVESATNGESAIKKVKKDLYDLMILDLMMEGIDGFDVARELKSDSELKKLPIIMLTAKNDETDVVTGLELGADDYISKPFSPKILIARVRAVLRRKILDEDADTVPANIMSHDIEVDPVRYRVSAGGKDVTLTHSEFMLLHFLIKRPGWVFTRNQIVDAIRGDNYAVTERSIDVQVVGLRKKLGKFGKLIETVRGIGYRFRE